MLTEIPTDQIHVRDDARSINADAVAALVESIGAVGLINPIRVRASGEGYELIAGAHRLEACKGLGLAEVTCVVVTDDDLHAELAMIDENLCRADLSPSDRAKQTARRKAIYQELHPSTRSGGDRKSDKFQSLKSDHPDSFAEATAQTSGRSVASVYLDTSRGENVLPEVLDMIRGTKLDTGVYLDKLKKMPGSEQYRAASRDLLNIRNQERHALAARTKIKLADAPLNDDAAREKQVAALMSAWNRATAEARQEFLERIEQPVFDRGAA